MKIKDFLRKYKEEITLSAVIILVALFSFGLGRLSVLYGGGGEFKIIYPEGQEAAVFGAGSLKVESGSEEELQPTISLAGQANLPPLPTEGAYVASKTGSKYHLPWCSGAQTIKEENKLYFNTKEEAKAAGYEPAGNCKGL